MKVNGVKVYIISAKQLVLRLGSDIDSLLSFNPRKGSINTTTARAMRETIQENPEAFIVHNRGINLVIHKGKSFIVDGGTTYQVLLDNQDNLTSVKVLVKEMDIEPMSSVSAIAQTLNLSTAIKYSDLANSDAGFEEIKKALKGTAWEGRVQYKSGYRAPIRIVDVLRAYFATKCTSQSELASCYKLSESSLIAKYLAHREGINHSVFPLLLNYRAKILATFEDMGVKATKPFMLSALALFPKYSELRWQLEGKNVVSTLVRKFNQAKLEGHNVSTFGQSGRAYMEVA